MKYAKRDGRKVIHWPASINELIEARVAGDHDAYEGLRAEAINAAEQWHLCACGSLCKAIPRKEAEEYVGPYTSTEEMAASAKNAPLDKKLLKLGLRFMDEIIEEDFEDALKTQEKIEKRATEILTKMGLVKKSYGKPLAK